MKFKKAMAMLLAVAMVFTSVNLNVFSTAFAAGTGKAITGKTEITYKGEPVTFGTSNQDINYNGDVDVTWYKLKDGSQNTNSIDSYEKIKEAPTNVGKYAVTIASKQEVTDETVIETSSEELKDETSVAPFFFEITKAKLAISWPDDSSMVYNGSDVAEFKSTSVTGFVKGDNAKSITYKGTFKNGKANVSEKPLPVNWGNALICTDDFDTDLNNYEFGEPKLPEAMKVTKADLNLEWPSNISKVVDGTNQIKVKLIYKGGLVGEDAIENPTITSTVTLADSVVGTHDVKSIDSLCIEGDVDLNNYNWIEEKQPTEGTINQPTPVLPVEPEEPEIQEPVEPEVVMPEAPAVPETGANIGMDQETKKETDKVLGTILENIIKPSAPDQEKPAPQTESEKETAKTEAAIAEAVQNAEQVKIAVEASHITKENASQEVKAEVEKMEKEIANVFGDTKAEILQFADIQVSAVAVSQAGDQRDLGNLRNLSDKIAFTVQLPANTEGENFGVARVHDGIMELLPAEDVTYDPITKKITFKTDKFSTYAVYTYEDAPVVPEQPEQPEQPAKPAMVKNVKVKTDNGLLKVTFNKVKGADSYRVYVKQAGKAWRWYNGNNQGTMIKKIYKENLVKNGQYQVKVAAFNDDVRGDYSKIVKVYANRIGTKSAVMPAPKFVSIKTKNGVTKVTVKNIKFNSNPKKVAYKVSYKVKGAKKWNKSEFSFNNVKTIKGLKKGKTYNFALKYRYKSALDNKTFVYSKIVYKNAKVK